MTMFADWTDEKLLEEVENGFREYAEIRVKDNQDIITHRESEIQKKMTEIKQLQWEIEVSSRDIEEWNEVIERIDALTAPVSTEPTPSPSPITDIASE